jgi:hypothetical protein
VLAKVGDDMANYRRTKLQKRPSTAYAQYWRVIDGAVADAFNHHPDYLTPRGHALARASIVKRVTGAIESFAGKPARGRTGAISAAGKDGVALDAPSGSARVNALPLAYDVPAQAGVYEAPAYPLMGVNS